MNSSTIVLLNNLCAFCILEIFLSLQFIWLDWLVLKCQFTVIKNKQTANRKKIP